VRARRADAAQHVAEIRVASPRNLSRGSSATARPVDDPVTEEDTAGPGAASWSPLAKK
jgi:hypothetical protein